MEPTKIQLRLAEIIRRHDDMQQIRTFLGIRGQKAELMTRIDMAQWLEQADVDTKHSFLNIIADGYRFGDYGLRICDVCGKFMLEGYLDGDFNHFCSDDCAIKFYTKEYGLTEDRAQQLLMYDLEHSPDDVFWTEWVLD